MRYFFVLLFPISLWSLAEPIQSSSRESVTKNEFFAILEQNPTIKKYLDGKSSRHVQPVLQTIELINQYTVRGGASALSALLERLAKTIAENPNEFEDEKVIAKMRQPLTVLLERFVYGRQHEIAVEIFDQLWLWGPEHLPFLASKIRNNAMTNFTTQTLWAFKNATQEQREAFIAETENDAIVSWHCRWFAMAIALMNGHEFSSADQIKFMRSLSMVNPHRFLPPPKAKVYHSQQLMTSVDLYNMAVASLRTRAQEGDEIVRKARAVARGYVLDPRFRSDRNSLPFQTFMENLFETRMPFVSGDRCHQALD